MKNAIMLITACALALFTLAGCKAAPPETPAVMSKDVEEMVEKAAGTPSVPTQKTTPEQVAAPGNYALDIEEGKLKISINADVAVPDAELPIVRVRARDFTQEEVYAMFREFVGDAVIYNDSRQATKPELEKYIEQAKQTAAEMRSTPDDPDNMDTTYGGNAGYADHLEKEYIPMLEKQYLTAPGQREYTVADGTLTLMPMSESGGDYGMMMAVQAFENVGDWSSKGSQGKRFTAYNNPVSLGSDVNEYNGASISYEDHNIGQLINKEDVLTPACEERIGMTAEAAKDKITEILERLELPFTVSEIFYVNDEGMHPDAKEEELKEGYGVLCTRLINGAPAASIYGQTNADIVTDVNDPYGNGRIYRSWSYERMTFGVNSEGIFGFSWVSPLEIMDTQTERSQLMPFSGIESIFTEMLKVIYLPRADMLIDTEKLEVNVDSIELGLLRVRDQNSIVSGMFVPAWVFKGTEERTMTYGERIDEQKCLLAINAVDGSIIDTGETS